MTREELLETRIAERDWLQQLFNIASAVAIAGSFCGSATLQIPAIAAQGITHFLARMAERDIEALR